MMKSWTEQRQPDTPDECWITEHPPVFTLGQSASKLLPHSNPHKIPVVQSDRGGKITYHGPGQIILYLLVDLRRASLKVKDLVYMTEESVINFLSPHSIIAHRRPSMPGVYVENIKIASIGYRIRHGRSYHGLSINYSMDMSPFSLIDVCGYADITATDLRSLGLTISSEQVCEELVAAMKQLLGYSS